MAKAVPIESCKNCPHFLETPYPTDDSFERPSYWWCRHPEVKEVICEHEDDERRRLQIASGNPLRKIMGYVEWHEEAGIKIPKWCPLPNII